MKRLNRFALNLGITLILSAASVSAAPGRNAEQWPLWEKFCSSALSVDGRIIDAGDPRQITTSEGQSYALFFALAANDQERFTRILEWTSSHLCAGNCSKHLPAWLWGRIEEPAAKGEPPRVRWDVIDSNNATDADLWMAYTLLEAGRLWERSDLTASGRALLDLILKKLVLSHSGLGQVVQPGQTGFTHDTEITLNPSYLPIMLLRRFALEDPRWRPVISASVRSIVRASPNGLAPDWARFDQDGRLTLRDNTIGGWDAIRVYLWAGMISPDDPAAAQLRSHFNTMRQAVEARLLPPERSDASTLFVSTPGPDAFSAAFLGWMRDERVGAFARTLLACPEVGRANYYKSMLMLFGLGFDSGRFAFDRHGRLYFPMRLP